MFVHLWEPARIIPWTVAVWIKLWRGLFLFDFVGHGVNRSFPLGSLPLCLSDTGLEGTASVFYACGWTDRADRLVWVQNLLTMMEFLVTWLGPNLAYTWLRPVGRSIHLPLLRDRFDTALRAPDPLRDPRPLASIPLRMHEQNQRAHDAASGLSIFAHERSHRQMHQLFQELMSRIFLRILILCWLPNKLSQTDVFINALSDDGPSCVSTSVGLEVFNWCSSTGILCHLPHHFSITLIKKDTALQTAVWLFLTFVVTWTCRYFLMHLFTLTFLLAQVLVQFFCSNLSGSVPLQHDPVAP